MWQLEAINRLCERHPRLRHSRLGKLDVLQGEIRLHHSVPGIHEAPINESYAVRIFVPPRGDDRCPAIFELRGDIPRTPDWHIFAAGSKSDGQICLGSTLRVLTMWRRRPEIDHFVQTLLEPYLVAATLRRRGHESFIFGELAHGAAGLIDDYEQLFGVQGKFAVGACLRALAKKPSKLVKTPCPCGCDRRLVECRTGRVIEDLRPFVRPREISKLLRGLESPKLKAATRGRIR